MITAVLLQEANTYTDMADRDQYRKRINLLCEAASVNPNDNRLVKELFELVFPEADSPPPNIRWLRDSVIGAPQPGVIHTLLGLYQISQGNFSEGQGHWKIATSFKYSPILVTRLLQHAANHASKDFPNLLDAITLAIEMFPDQPMLYAIRGNYFRKERIYENAITDLQNALKLSPEKLSVDRLAIRRWLVDCYQNQSPPDHDSADREQKIIEEELKKFDPKVRDRVQKIIDSLQ